MAKQIGAVNTIQFVSGKTYGQNTDYLGFIEAIRPFLHNHHKKALILGSGGGAKAVKFAFKKLGIATTEVSRIKRKNTISYHEIDELQMSEHQLIINTTPLGMYPQLKTKPAIPYSFLSKKHLLFDLVYNPQMTEFLQSGANHGAVCSNGLKMLEFQAEMSWKIWNNLH